jgi:hypothetical protein
MGVSQLVPPLPNLPVPGQDAVHRPFRAEVAFIVQETRVDLSGSEIGEPGLVQDVEHRRLLPGESARGEVRGTRSTFGSRLR